MTPVAFELVRQLQDERQAEAAAHRLVRCLPGVGDSRAPQWLRFRAAPRLFAGSTFVGAAANGAESHVQSSAPQ
jgi:hypothetical protein